MFTNLAIVWGSHISHLVNGKGPLQLGHSAICQDAEVLTDEAAMGQWAGPNPPISSWLPSGNLT